MKISFVIPAYNEAAHIGACIEAIQKSIAHAKTDAEIIVVDNASQDATANIASQYRDVQVVHEPRKGIVKARARGLSESKGDLIANIDADVIVPNEWLSTVIKEFNKDSKLVCLSGPFIYHDLSIFKRAMVRVFYIIGFFLYIFFRFIVKKGSMTQGGNFVIRRWAIDRAGGFDTNIDFYGEDTDIARRLTPHGKVKWTFRLPVFASGRRLKAEGIFTTGLRYTINYLWIMLFKKPFTNTSHDIRPQQSPRP